MRAAAIAAALLAVLPAKADPPVYWALAPTLTSGQAAFLLQRSDVGGKSISWIDSARVVDPTLSKRYRHPIVGLAFYRETPRGTSAEPFVYCPQHRLFEALKEIDGVSPPPDTRVNDAIVSAYNAGGGRATSVRMALSNAATPGYPTTPPTPAPPARTAPSDPTPEATATPTRTLPTSTAPEPDAPTSPAPPRPMADSWERIPSPWPLAITLGIGFLLALVAGLRRPGPPPAASHVHITADEHERAALERAARMESELRRVQSMNAAVEAEEQRYIRRIATIMKEYDQ